MDPREEDELRNLIRRELENREKLRGSSEGDGTGRRVPEEMSAERRRIIEDEIESFYRQRGGYRRFENEEGEIEWLTEQEIREREGQIPVDMEELEAGQRKVRNRLLAILLLGLLGLILLFVLVREQTGSVQVICNVPGATILLNGSPTEFVTDHRLDKVPVGPQMISVSKYGYVSDGPANARIELHPGEDAIVMLKLKPQSADSLGRPR